MRLINVKTLELEEHFDDSCPPYAILSHVWSKEEVTLQEWQSNPRPTLKSGYSKIMRACQQTVADGLEYLWCDTNCIDKSSSAELSEAINSMFRWYRRADVCYAYLADVTCRQEIAASRWMTRGWTLQELLAPQKMTFLSTHWQVLGSRLELSPELLEGTGIPIDFLNGRPMYAASVAQRMSWVARRRTTRVEDMAYCMLGIFDINLPPLYGEGPKAFIRLQEEIIRVSSDHSLFCWEWMPKHMPSSWASLLAPNPRVFETAQAFVPHTAGTMNRTYSIANGNLIIRLPYTEAMSTVFVSFDAAKIDKDDNRTGFLSLPLRRLHDSRGSIIRTVNYSEGSIVGWARTPYPPKPVILGPVQPSTNMQFVIPTGSSAALDSTLIDLPVPHAEDVVHAVLLIFDGRVSNSDQQPDSGVAAYSHLNVEHSLIYLDHVQDLKTSRGVYNFPHGQPILAPNKTVRVQPRLTVFFAAKADQGGGHDFFCEYFNLPDTAAASGTRLLWTLRGAKSKSQVDALTTAAQQDQLSKRMMWRGEEIMKLNKLEQFVDHNGMVVQVVRFTGTPQPSISPIERRWTNQ